MRFLCIFAVPRTGSSHLNKLLRSCPGVNAKSEMFHSRAKIRFSKDELERLAIKSCGATSDNAKFAKWRRDHPAETLEALRDAGGAGIVAFKVFPAHLKKDKLNSEFLGRTDIAFAILRRRPIECFISVVKAKSMSRFGVVDTTEIKPNLSPGEFVEWAQRMKRWYKWVGKALEGRGMPYAEISFERHLDGLSGAESLSRILPLLEPLGFFGIEMPSDVIEGQRQDKEIRYQDRVANWDEFLAEVETDPEHAALLKWAKRAS